jgi:hypothetical protein
MTEHHYDRRADDGSMLHAALMAVVLIVAGLGLMAWDDGRQTTTPASIGRQQ